MMGSRWHRGGLWQIWQGWKKTKKNKTKSKTESTNKASELKQTASAASFWREVGRHTRPTSDKLGFESRRRYVENRQGGIV